MRKILLTAIILHLVVINFGQIAGPNSALIHSNVPIPGSNKSWSDLSNTTSSDDHHAIYGTLDGGANSYSDYLQATVFSLSVPGGAIIKGIEVEVERSDVFENTRDYSVRIVKSGTISEFEMKSTAVYTADDNVMIYGGNNNLWNESWTVDDVNSDDFGVAISCSNILNENNEGKIDDIRITVYYSFVVLPVKLNSFQARKAGQKVEINWTTSEESNMQQYEVERSFNGNHFIAIQTMNSRNSVNAAGYATMDSRPSRGINYYRLKMIDNTGLVSYSRIAVVQFSNGKNYSLYPSLLRQGEMLNISNLNGDKLTIEFYNNLGALAARVQTTERTIPSSVFKTIKGVIYYKLKNEEGLTIGSGNLLIQ